MLPRLCSLFFCALSLGLAHLHAEDNLLPVPNAEAIPAIEAHMLTLSNADQFAQALRVFDFFASFAQDPDAAEPWLARAEAIAARNPSPASDARIFLERARMHLLRDAIVPSLEAAEAARRKVEEAHLPQLKAAVFKILGDTFNQSRDYAKAFEFYEQAMQSIDTDGGDPDLRPRILNSIAICAWRLKRWQDAEKFLRQALTSWQDQERHAKMLENNIGVAVLEQGRFHEAEALFLSAKAYSTQEGLTATLTLNNSNLGDLYQRWGQPHKALTFLDPLIAATDPPTSQYVLIRSLRHRGRAFLQLERLDDAIADIKQSLALARTANDPAEVAESLDALIEAYESIGDFRSALHTVRERAALETTLLTETARTRNDLFRVQFEAIDKERQLATLLAERERQRLQRSLFIAAILTFAILSLLLWNKVRFQRKATTTLSQQKEFIESQRAALESANAHLNRLNREKDDILSVAAHDLRNPLSACVQLADILQNDPDSLDASARAELIADIHSTAASTLGIVNQLMDLQSIEHANAPLPLESIPAAPTLDALKRRFAPALHRKHQSLHIKTTQPDLAAQANPDALNRILDNLLSNALKFSPPHSTIQISAHCDPAHTLHFSVIDQGPGISEADRAKLFRKFAKLSSQPTGGESSTGLGLAIAQSLAQNMHGSISCQSTQGNGSTFILSLPAQPAAATTG